MTDTDIYVNASDVRKGDVLWTGAKVAEVLAQEGNSVTVRLEHNDQVVTWSSGRVQLKRRGLEVPPSTSTLVADTDLLLADNRRLRAALATVDHLLRAGTDPEAVRFGIRQILADPVAGEGER